jgi:hypothetical protein
MIAICIMLAIVTTIPNIIFAYKYFISKKYRDIYEAGFIHFMCLYIFICLLLVVGTVLIYNIL